jgi:4-hydroxy-tetrahydrodipicolinate reductase
VSAANATANVAIVGAAGRMGRMLVSAAGELDNINCTVAIEHPAHDALGSDAGTLAGVEPLGVAIEADLAGAVDRFDTMVVFSLPEPTIELLDICVTNGKAAVIGTTGFTPEQRAHIGACAASIPVVFAPNMSVGVNVMFKLIEIAASVLGDSADVEVIEAHHRHKVDAPSGTAVKMGEILAEALGRDLATDAVYGRHGAVGPRERKTIGFETIRGGDIVGDHTVLFAGEGERIELVHRSHTRANFAHGALRAAAWLQGRAPGLYDMGDVLGLNAHS